VLGSVKLPRMKKREIEKLINEQLICRIAFGGEEYPYIAPFQYVFVNGTLYFHFTDYGRKMRFLEKERRVCVEIEVYRPDLSEYRFVVLRGKLKTVADPQERAHAVKKMAEDGEKKLSENFLAAHGLRKDDGWSSLNPKKPLVIVKLEDVIEELGLKSP
jgi:nitroimidazol reductase NimA-like FMN-containing flavoprotein (pyridoxamine 5'-phosphate oxidase superfamily)